MTDEFDAIFSGRQGTKPTFVERTGRAPAQPETGPEPAAAGSGDAALPNSYKAFGFLPTNVGESCDVQRWVDGTEIPEGIELQYRFLLQIAYTGEEELKLYLPECIVLITGQNLRELRKKLARRQVTFIQQYSAKVWPNGAAKGEAIVEAIEILRPDPNGPGRNW